MTRRRPVGAIHTTPRYSYEYSLLHACIEPFSKEIKRRLPHTVDRFSETADATPKHGAGRPRAEGPPRFSETRLALLASCRMVASHCRADALDDGFRQGRRERTRANESVCPEREACWIGRAIRICVIAPTMDSTQCLINHTSFPVCLCCAGLRGTCVRAPPTRDFGTVKFILGEPRSSFSLYINAEAT